MVVIERGQTISAPMPFAHRCLVNFWNFPERVATISVRRDRSSAFPVSNPASAGDCAPNDGKRRTRRGVAPRVVLTTPGEAALRYVALEDLKLKSLDLS